MASHTIMAPTQADLSQPPDEDEAAAVLSSVGLDHYRPFFREFDLDVLKLFSIDKVKNVTSAQKLSLLQINLLFRSRLYYLFLAGIFGQTFS
jgi:hypothetical protein